MDPLFSNGEEVEVEGNNLENGSESTDQNREEEEKGEHKVLKFLDSVDSYLTLFGSLSSTLRQVDFAASRSTTVQELSRRSLRIKLAVQLHFHVVAVALFCLSQQFPFYHSRGYFELATARQSMGGSRINSALYDLKYHRAATSLQVKQEEVKEPNFTLCKWASTDCKKWSSEEEKIDEDELSGRRSTNSQLRYRGTSEIQEKIPENNGSTLAFGDQIQHERSKSLSMFGKLVSPKLRDAQLSFETALDTLVEIANVRSSLLLAYDQVRKDMEVDKKVSPGLAS